MNKTLLLGSSAARIFSAYGPKPLLAPDGGSVGQIVTEFQTLRREMKSSFDASADAQSGFEARLREIEQKAVRGDAGGYDAPAETWGATVANSDQYKALGSLGSGKIRIAVKATITTASNSGGALAPSDRQIGPNGLPQRRIRFRDVLTPGRTDSTSVEYPRQVTRTNAAATVAEGALKPESALAWETVTSPTRTIATLLPASKQILDDAPMMQSIIDGELRYLLADVEEGQLLNGGGTGTDILGVYTQATDFAPVFTLPAPTMIDVILLAIAQASAANYEADSITLNPLDWAKILSLKKTDGGYLGSGPFSAEQIARLWTLPVVATPAMSAGNFMVGTSTAAQIFDRQDATVEISTEHSDFFARNLVMMRAEERLALAVYRPGAFIKGAFAASITAATDE